MDEELKRAAERGDIAGLYSLIDGDPSILNRLDALPTIKKKKSLDALPFDDTPLHIAARHGKTRFAMEIANLKPSLVRKLNKNGFSPMHLALEGGHWSIVRGLLQTDKEVVRVKGKGGRTPLHEAAVKGNTDLLREFLSACPESIEDLTVQLETALHLAVKWSKLEAFELLMKWVKEENKMRIANWKDDEGNTVFHVATSTNQIEFVKLLLRKRYKRDLEVNAINSEGLTAADLGLQTREGENPDQIFRHAGALKAQEIPSDKRSFKHVIFKVVNHLTTILSEEYLYYFRYRRDRDSPGEVRNVLLVVLGLIVSATYQTGVNPPSYHLPPGFLPFINSTSINTIHGERLCRLFGRSDKDDGLDIFVYPQFNSLAFFFSLAMMVVLTTGFPMQIELMIALMLLVFNFLHSSAVFQGPGYFLNPFSWFFLLWFIWKAVQILLELGLLGRSRKSAAAGEPVSHIRDADSVKTPLVGPMQA